MQFYQHNNKLIVVDEGKAFICNELDHAHEVPSEKEELVLGGIAVSEKPTRKYTKNLKPLKVDKSSTASHKLTPKNREEIAKMLDDGVPVADIARRFNVSSATINYYLKKFRSPKAGKSDDELDRIAEALPVASAPVLPANWRRFKCRFGHISHDRSDKEQINCKTPECESEADILT